MGAVAASLRRFYDKDPVLRCGRFGLVGWVVRAAGQPWPVSAVKRGPGQVAGDREPVDAQFPPIRRVTSPGADNKRMVSIMPS